MRSPLKYFILFVIVTFKGLSTHSQTVERPLYTALQGATNMIPGASLYLADDKWWQPTEKAKIDTSGYYRIKNIITFSLREDSAILIKTNFTANVDVIIYDTTRSGSGDSTVHTFTINFDTAKGASYNLKNAFVFYNGYKVKAALKTNITFSASLSSSDSLLIKSLVKLENEMQITRDYKFSCTTTTDSLGLALSDSVLSTVGEIVVGWNNIPGATEYDLEWSFIDQESIADTGLYKTSGSLDPKKIFTDNATRVTINSFDSLVYRIPMLYDTAGILYVRVRPVQIRSGSRRYEGRWSSDGGTIEHYDYFGGHENRLNWQASTSFAEEGKRKSVVQYFDGTLRNRQTVTKDNTTNTTVVAESFYDFQGRAVIQVLPAPTLNTIIGYTKNFNLAGINTEYTKSLYDSVIAPQDYCLGSAPAMDSSSGAANYYSSSNPLSSGTGVGNNSFNKFIPKAAGYAFTETRYEQDNTGRIKSQSGVGPNHIIGSGHETRYLYGNPGQEELDALFGTEVGYASHYFKNMVRDANGQYSISYVDMHGRTIATALAGKTPTGMDSLESNKTRLRTEKLADSTNNLQYGLVLESSRSITVPVAGDYVFNYSLNSDSVKIKSCILSDICYDCLYNLIISVTDDCNNCKLPGSKAYVVVDTNFTGATVDTLCNAPVGFSKTFTLSNLPEGNYTITKRLEVNKQRYEYYRDSVFLVKNSCRTFQDFYAQAVDSVKSGMDCSTITCSSCSTRLANFNTYRVTYLNEGGIPLSDSALYKTQITNAYNKEKELCNSICQSFSDELSIRQLMLQDMTPPYGQYANPDSSLDNSFNAYNIFKQQTTPIWKNTAITYYDENGKIDSIYNDFGTLVKVTDASITRENYIANFKPSWANSLLAYHPEYNKLLYYEKRSKSHVWDKDFAATDTYADADAKGYLRPWATLGSAPTPSHFSNVSGSYDPLVKADSVLNPRLPNAIYEYQVASGVGTYSVWGIASMSAKCPDPDVSSCYGRYINSTLNNCINPSTFCTGELDMAWRAFREIYLSKKRKMLMDKMDTLYPISPAIPTYRFVHFKGSDPSSSSYGTYVSGNSSSTVTSNMQGQLQQFYTDNCTSYAQSWYTALAPCNLTAADSLRLIPRMVQICVGGSDATHTFGSSSTAPGSSLTYKSFEALVKHYIDSMHAVNPSQYNYDMNCNVYSIYYPMPYDQQAALSNIPLWTKPDSCQCAQVSSYYTAYQALHSGDTMSFATYVYQETGTQMSNTDLTKLRNLCSGADTCKFMVTPIDLPPALQCGVKDVCIDCIKMQKVLDSFKITFPGIYPNYNFSDSTQELKNRIFANFANYKLGFSKQAVDYLGFMDQCGIHYISSYTSSFSCDTLKQILDTFKNSILPNYINPPIAYNANGCDTITYNFQQTPIVENGTIRFMDMFTHTGVVSWPSAVLDTLTTTYCKYQFNYNHCIKNLTGGFTYEAKIKAPVIDSITNVYRYLILGFGTNRNGGSVDYFTFGQLNGQYNNGTPYTELGVDMLNYRVFKIQFKKDSIKVYVDDTLRKVIAATGTATSITNFSNQFGYLNGFIDYIKITDSAGTVIFNDQLNSGCSSFAKPLFNNRCDIPDCETIFKNYFNTRLGTSYTNYSIDTLYRNQCGIFVDYCTPYSGPKLCGKNEALFPPVSFTDPDPCADSTSMAYTLATELYNAYLDSLKNAFDSVYLSKCLKAFKTESFTVTHPDNIYHYTLYYYDQAGNLVKTIPPAGVDTTHFANTAWIDSVTLARKNGTVKIPSHGLATEYRYNTLNQVTEQKTPDAGISNFWYDRLGRLALSRNSKQKANSATESGRLYSYTLYDQLGRINEVGQMKNNTSDTISDSIARDVSLYYAWLNASGNTKGQITRTIYDFAYPPFATAGSPVMAKNLRNRVAYTMYVDTVNASQDINNFNQATFYSYDIHGNVDTLLQDYGSNSVTATQNIMNSNNISGGADGILPNRWKKIVYRYDLISGKVNHVAYQPGQLDAFYHKYLYDAENRITNVYTSSDSTFWEKESRYSYYKHGPVARTVLGDQLVQGLDYAYTIQGWLKAVNSTILSPTIDMGLDGNTANQSTKYIARDAFGFNLNYFAGDYYNIGGTNPVSTYSSNLPSGKYRPLYNGNISSMAVNIAQFNNPLLYNYKYDQLNRITEMDAYKGLNRSNNTWDSISVYGSYADYKERIAYDPNGNILKYLRNGVYDAGSPSKLLMDSLTYKYSYDGNGVLQNNRLNWVADNVASNTYSSSAAAPFNVDDIDDQSAYNTTGKFNYLYDEIGNLVRDSSEKITNIKWSVYGKILQISKDAHNVGDVKEINYTYDASGNRISKTVIKIGGHSTQNYYITWYVRDASGNVMSTYDYTSEGAVFSLSDQELYKGESYIYGSSRIGSFNGRINMETAVQDGNSTGVFDGPGSTITWNGINFSRGKRNYELDNHLGNVMVTISDKKLGHDSTSGIIDYYNADVVSANDYYPFGMMQPGRSYSAGSQYRYGFNGKEKDKSINDGSYDFGARIYDARISRWFSCDLISKSYISPFNYSSNNPTNYIDPNGEDNIHFYHVISRVYVDGKVVGIKATKYSVVEKNNEPNVFVHHRVELRFDGIGAAEKISLTKNVDTRFYPDVPGEKSGLTTSYGFLKIKDDDRKTLIKFIDEYGLSKGDVDASGGQSGYTEVSRPGSSGTDRMKKSLWWADVFKDKKYKEDQEKEQALRADIIIGGALLFGGEMLLAGKTVNGAVTLEKNAFEKFVEHAFRNGRNADIGVSTEAGAVNTVNLITENQSKLKEGTNYLIGRINGVEKSILVDQKDGVIRSINMYSKISKRVNDTKNKANVINIGSVTW